MTDQITLDANPDGSFTLPDGSTATIASIRIVPPAPKPSLTADFKIVRVSGLAVAVQDCSQVVGGTITSIKYAFAPNVTSSGRAGANASATLPAAGTYAIVQTVTDSNGHTATATHAVTVPDQIPAPTAPSTTPASASPASPQTPAAPKPGAPTAAANVSVNGATVTVSDVSAKGAGNLQTALIDFGDGEPPLLCKTGSSIPHVVAKAGTYTGSITASDSNLNTATAPFTYTTTVDMPELPAAAGDVTVRAMVAGGSTFALAPPKGARVAMPCGGSVMYYGDGACVCVENMTLGTTGDLFLYVIIEAAGKEIYRGNLALWAYAGAQPFWIAEPAPNLDFDRTPFPEYEADAANAPSLYAKCMAADNGPMGFSIWDRGLADTGERMDLGPLDGASVRCLNNLSTENIAVVRMLANATRVFPFHMVDPATMKMVSLVGNPKIAMDGGVLGAYGNLVPKYTSATPINLSQAAGHAPTFSALAAALRGSAYDEEELSLWANYVGGLWNTWVDRLPCGVNSVKYGETRGKGRALNAILYASKLSDAPAYFEAWAEASAAEMSIVWPAQTGVQIDWYEATYLNNRGFANWQLWIVIDAAGRAIDYGHAAAQPALDYFAICFLDSILNSQHEFSTLSHWYCRDDSGAPLADWNAVLAYTAKQNTLSEGYNLPAALPCAENSPELMAALYPGNTLYVAGDFANSPVAPTGYVAQMRIAMAAIARHATDQTRAQKALAVYQAHQRIDFSTDPKYNLKLPRAV